MSSLATWWNRFMLVFFGLALQCNHFTYIIYRKHEVILFESWLVMPLIFPRCSGMSWLTKFWTRSCCMILFNGVSWAFEVVLLYNSLECFFLNVFLNDCFNKMWTIVGIRHEQCCWLFTCLLCKNLLCACGQGSRLGPQYHVLLQWQNNKVTPAATALRELRVLPCIFESFFTTSLALYGDACL